jgi:BolA protein
MTMQSRIERRLQDAFAPLHLEVVNESHMHNVPAGSESHFKVTVVSEQFDGQMLIKRHRAINQALSEEIAAIHALALHTMTPEEWFAKGGQSPDSPPCLGGSKATQ